MARTPSSRSKPATKPSLKKPAEKKQTPAPKKPSSKAPSSEKVLTPAAKKPVTTKPVAVKPATTKPVAVKPATSKPASPKTSSKAVAKPAKPGSKTAKAAGKPKKDRSELLRRLLDLRSGYQRPQEEPAAKKAKKRPAPVERPAPRITAREPETVVPVPKPAKLKKAKMRKRDVEKLRKILEGERDRMVHDLEVLDEMTNSKHDGGGIEITSFSIHLAEHATDNSTLETTLMQRHLIEERLSQVLDALKRMEDGTFGSCELCGDTITVERLLAKPHARLCIDCRRNLESRRARSVG